MGRLKTLSICLQEFSKLVEKLSKKIPSAFLSSLESCQQLLVLFRDLSIDANEAVCNSPSLEFNATADKAQSKSLPPNLFEWLKELEDSEEEHVKGHALLTIGSELRKRNTKIFKTSAEFDLVYEKVLGMSVPIFKSIYFSAQLEHSDTYVFLAAINALAELAYWKTEPFLGRMVELFVKWQSDDEGLKFYMVYLIF